MSFLILHVYEVFDVSDYLTIWPIFLTIWLSILTSWVSDLTVGVLHSRGRLFLERHLQLKDQHPSKCDWFVNDVFFVVNFGSVGIVVTRGKVQYGVLLIKVLSAIGLGKFQNCWNQNWSPLFLCLAKVPIFKCQNMALCIFLIVFVLFFLLHRQIESKPAKLWTTTTIALK